MLPKDSDAGEGDKPKYSAIRAVIGMSLILPWVVIDMVLKKTDPSLGYSTGLFIGVMSGYLLAPNPPRLWIILLIATLLAGSHFLFVPHY